MRTSLLLGLVGLALVGCRGGDPCSGVSGTCLSLTVQGPAGTSVDRLTITTSGLVVRTADSTVPAAKALPILVGVQLPDDASGELDVHVDGHQGVTLVGSGDTQATVSPRKHTSATVTLTSVIAMPDGGDDLSNADLSTLPPDLTPPPDLTGTICTPSTNTGCADASTLEYCSSDGFAKMTHPCPSGCIGSGSAAHCKYPVATGPVGAADYVPYGTATTTFSTGSFVVDGDSGAITPGIRTANTDPTVFELHQNIGYWNHDGLSFFAFGDVTIPQGATLIVTGTRPVVFTSTGTVSLIGTIDGRYINTSGMVLCDSERGGPGGGSGGVASNTGTPANGVGPGFNYGYGASAASSSNENPGGGGGAFGGDGGQGGNGYQSATVKAGGYGGTHASPTPTKLRGGGGGGSGAGGTGGASGAHGAGGGGGGGIQIVAMSTISLGGGGTTGGINVSGCGGHGGTNSGGGGGGSGGMIILEAPTVTFLSFTFLAANGGGGGGGGASTAGGFGTTSDLNGGNAGGGSATSPSGAGANGSSQGVADVTTQAAGASSSTASGAGGGGGGAGWIIINNSAGTGTCPCSPQLDLNPHGYKIAGYDHALVLQ